MNRTEFILVTAAILFVAFALGWFLSWLVYRVARVTQSDMTELDTMAQALHDAEENLEQAVAYAQARESELMAKLSQSEAELRAAMDGLREARQDAEEMRVYVERISAGR